MEDLERSLRSIYLFIRFFGGPFFLGVSEMGADAFFFS